MRGHSTQLLSQIGDVGIRQRFGTNGRTVIGRSSYILVISCDIL